MIDIGAEGATELREGGRRLVHRAHEQDVRDLF